MGGEEKGYEKTELLRRLLRGDHGVSLQRLHGVAARQSLLREKERETLRSCAAATCPRDRTPGSARSPAAAAPFPAAPGCDSERRQSDCPPPV